MVRPISAKEAKKITMETGYCWTSDGNRTYFAADDDNEVYEFDTKAERDNFINNSK